MTGTANDDRFNSHGERLAFNERKLAAGILALVSQFFAEARKLNVGDRPCFIINSDEGQPETESFIDVGDAENPGNVIARYAITLQKISR